MIHFTKMHGAGNDYVYISEWKNPITNLSELAKTVSNRHFGIGSDGLVYICKSSIADAQMRMLNSDGSESAMCGNAIRCVGKYLYENDIVKKDTITIETKAGIKILTLTIENNKVVSVRVDMGKPVLEVEKIPYKGNKKYCIEEKILLDQQEFEITAVSMGNPHAVIFVDDVENFDVHYYGKILEHHPLFPERVNVEFIQVIAKDTIKMRVWERGTGETLACGTGACAAAVAAILTKNCNQKLTVELLGGKLQIEWENVDASVFMSGTATKVFDGILEIDL